ncbi:hypothetical protein ACFTTO_30055, partial [Bacillus mobilis]
MKCPNCHTPSASSASSCSTCGTTIKASPVDNVAPVKTSRRDGRMTIAERRAAGIETSASPVITAQYR